MKPIPYAKDLGVHLPLIPKDNDLLEMIENHLSNARVFVRSLAKVAQEGIDDNKPPGLSHLTKSLAAHEELLDMNNKLYAEAKASPNFCGTFWVACEALIIWGFQLQSGIELIQMAIQQHQHRSNTSQS